MIHAYMVFLLFLLISLYNDIWAPFCFIEHLFILGFGIA